MPKKVKPRNGFLPHFMQPPQIPAQPPTGSERNHSIWLHDARFVWYILRVCRKLNQPHSPGSFFTPNRWRLKWFLQGKTCVGRTFHDHGETTMAISACLRLLEVNRSWWGWQSGQVTMAWSKHNSHMNPYEHEFMPFKGHQNNVQ